MEEKRIYMKDVSSSTRFTFWQWIWGQEGFWTLLWNFRRKSLLQTKDERSLGELKWLSGRRQHRNTETSDEGVQREGSILIKADFHQTVHKIKAEKVEASRPPSPSHGIMVGGGASKGLITMKQLCDETVMKPPSQHPEQFTLSVWSDTCKYETPSGVTKKEFVKQKNVSSERWTNTVSVVGQESLLKG